MDKDDHPELDQTAFLDPVQVTLYQSLIGCLQWAVTLGRFDILVSVMCMSRFRVEPREGHLERLKRIYGYLRKFPKGAIRFRTGIPPNEELFGEMEEHSWMYTVYENAEEEIDPNWPEPKGAMVRLSTYKDADLMHCKVTGRSCSGILHFLNQTPIHWFSKLQGTVEAATFGSEFVAGRIATDQIIEFRGTLRSMGVPIEEMSWLIGDNQSVITQSTVPQSMLTKRHNALSYHQVHWAIAAKILKFVKIPGTENISDVLTKYLP